MNANRPDVDLPALAQLELSLLAQVRAVNLAPKEAAWLRAIGLFEGQRVTVLRRALWGGPLHVRTGSGGEFAIDRALARAIEVQPLRAGRDGDPRLVGEAA